MAGLIREKSIQEVREKARIDDVVGQYVTLRRAGSGSLKGLCPFHDEKTPSFNVNTTRNFWHCFGCGEGGDVIAFMMKIDALSFAESVERLAEKYGVRLEREEGGREDRPRGPARGKLIEAHKVAQEFYAEQLTGPDALVARQFLAERQFDRDAAEHFGVGFAPRDGDALFKHLRGRGFTTEELVTAGLVAQGRSAYDRFRGRLVWPIREPGGDTIGFGARRLFDDDRIEAKYLNTPESPIYKKSHVLYGIDLARKEMGRTGQAVIVEGYTDVMAAHLSGITTAVATCGTAFGDDHAKVLRRFMADHAGNNAAFHGEVVFTFDGDAAGQAAAIKAFQGDQNFASQTYVAVEQSGMDPCELRMHKGEEAVRELIGGRQPLYRFVLGNVIAKYDLDRADGRVDALREAAQLVSSIRDRSKVDAFAREVAGMIGIDVDEARAQVRRAASRRPEPARPTRPGAREPQQAAAPAPAAPAAPDPRDPRFTVERETLKLVLQHPMAVGRTTAEVTRDDFTHPAYAAVWELISAAGGPSHGAGDAGWVARIRDAAGPELARVVSALAVEPVPTVKEPDATYVLQYVVRLLELSAMRRIADLRSRLQRADPSADPEGYDKMFTDLAALERHRHSLRERLVSG